MNCHGREFCGPGCTGRLTLYALSVLQSAVPADAGAALRQSSYPTATKAAAASGLGGCRIHSAFRTGGCPPLRGSTGQKCTHRPWCAASWHAGRRRPLWSLDSSTDAFVPQMPPASPPPKLTKELNPLLPEYLHAVAHSEGAWNAQQADHGTLPMSTSQISPFCTSSCTTHVCGGNVMCK